MIALGSTKEMVISKNKLTMYTNEPNNYWAKEIQYQQDHFIITT